MTVAAMDLWPDDILAAPETAPSPLELLNYQARRLEERTSGRLKVELSGYKTEDREALRFTVAVPSQDYRCLLFEVLHRPDFVLPASFVPPEPLPNYLREKYVKPGAPSPFAPSLPKFLESTPERTIENQWVANTPAEFQTKLQKLLQTQEVKALLASLITMARRPPKSNLPVTPANGAE